MLVGRKGRSLTAYVIGALATNFTETSINLQQPLKNQSGNTLHIFTGEWWLPAQILGLCDWDVTSPLLLLRRAKELKTPNNVIFKAVRHS